MTSAACSRCSSTENVNDFQGPVLCRPCRDDFWNERAARPEAVKVAEVRREDARIARAAR